VDFLIYSVVHTLPFNNNNNDNIRRAHTSAKADTVRSPNQDDSQN